ncbi:3-dehydroquinate synthase [Desulforamulus reducens MI-1]|uniref:3-dehydroquinate synthase n=1 Tax=Desulforamulus reducens (strain ATCC BAA-1160 / DSM 100696 / MI-1) TaxID=349161 RepID=AROB_DESRM|nr:3-dehydroquinate synthase [Desulforamulus reducens]A4J3A3.1 RecName: Full=3-dehydroquinate synthase; Short=DHQS [Desulforamulus reducens MI-1]ABO49556.1 3-dehydroquinate synthase [Desulforamulus reducens MI-1]
MGTIQVDLGNRSYPIYIASAILDKIGTYLSEQPLGKKVLLVTDQQVAPLYAPRVIESLKNAGFKVAVAEIPAGEPSKTLEQASRLYDLAFDHALDRQSSVIALGGGVVGDLAGFVAATYMRGVPFIQIPTTLLAQVDSSVGGKVAVNHSRGKNMIGAFYQPQMVMIDVATLQTLPERELKAGLAEVIKYGVIWDGSFFTWLEKNYSRILNLDTTALEQVAETCCKIKASVVEQDEREQGCRAILNYGHTVGHAIESLSGYGTYLHGEAVAMGMISAARLALNEGILSQQDFERIYRLISAVGLPTELPRGLGPQDIIDSMYHDKKTVLGKLVFVLPRSLGQVDIFKDVKEADILAVLSQ